MSRPPRSIASLALAAGLLLAAAAPLLALDPVAVDPHGENDSAILDVSGTWAVGEALPASDSLEPIAVAWDLSAAEPEPLGIGAFDGLGSSSAVAVDGDWAAGSASDAGGANRPFAWDLSGPVPVAIELGTLGGSTSNAVNAISGTWVVGRSDDGTVTPEAAARPSHRAAAWDLSADR